jgi:TRAP-type C4-dicarboxylate transport system permease small subunit
MILSGKTFHTLDNLAGRLSKGFMYVSMGMLFVMMLLGGLDVIGRYFFNQPISGTFEITEILLAGIVYFGVAFTQRVKGHATVDFFYGFLSGKTKVVVSFVNSFVVLCIFVMMIWRGTVTAITQLRIHQEVPNIGVPLFLFQLFVPIGAVTMSIVLVVEIFKFFNEARNQN